MNIKNIRVGVSAVAAAVLSFSSFAGLTVGTSNDPSAYEVKRADGKVAVVFTNALTSTTFTSNGGCTLLEALLVGGGGAGGGDCGAGGGAGGFVHLEGLSIELSDTLTFTVGAGGTTKGAKTRGYNGGNTTITLGGNDYVALGGGGGGQWGTDSATKDGKPGGCGGGSESSTTAASIQFSTYGYGVGYPGGKGNTNAGGGGGGAGEAGHDYSGSSDGNGGAGAPCSITGTEVFYAGGGGAGAEINKGYTAGCGGKGGGGDGLIAAGEHTAGAGTDGLGGGGGGGGGGGIATGTGGKGGTGCVILLVNPDATSILFADEPTVERDGSDFKVRVRTTETSGTGTIKTIAITSASSVTNLVTETAAADTEYVQTLTGLAADKSYAACFYGVNAKGTETATLAQNCFHNGTLAIEKGSDYHFADLSRPATVLVSRADTYGDLVINYTVNSTGTAGTHYQPLSGTLVIPDGATSATIDIYPVATIPGDCTVTITLADGLYFVNDAAKTATVLLGRKNPARGFAKKIEFTVSYVSGSTLSDFPALVRLSTSAIAKFSYGNFRLPNGGDLRFVTEDGTPLAHEIETWDTSGESLVWVKVPSFAEGQKIIAYYGNPSPWAALPAADVWKTGYLGVWHFDEIADGVTPDATGNGLAMTAKDATTQVVAADGQIGSALVNCAASDSSNGGFVSPAYTEKFSSDAFTISGWINRLGHKLNGYERYFSAKDDTSATYGFVMENSKSQTGFSVRGSSASWRNFTSSADTTVAGWHLYTLVFNDKTVTVYVDGAAVANLDVAKVVHNLGFAVGNNATLNEQAVWGNVDEVRFAKSCLSADWIKAEYDMQSGTNVFTNTGASYAANRGMAIIIR